MLAVWRRGGSGFGAGGRVEGKMGIAPTVAGYDAKQVQA